MKEYKLQRTDDVPLRFTGELIAEGSSESEDGPRSRSWHTVDVYQTRGGQWIGHVWFNSGTTSQPNEDTVMVAESQEELRQQLLAYEQADSKSYKFALAQALGDDETFVEEIE
jgi:hypothetical protein